ncbi:unnamed protein product [Rhizophagus irregularis]|nr:unnamed protein product [Rhizophagus irregularis]
MSKHSLFNFLSNILQPVSEDKRKHPYVIIKDKNNEVSIGFVKKRTHIKKNGEKIECLNIEICNIEICLDNPQKAIIQKQECPKMITINQHDALVLPIFIQNIDIQQLEKPPTINLNGDNLGLWINRWIEQDTFKQELTNIRHKLKSLKNIEYYTDGSLANRTISNDNLSHIINNTTVDLGAAFYTNNELGEFSVYSCLSLWPSSTRAEIGHSGITGNEIADKLAKKGQYGNNLFKNNKIYFEILATGEATEWSLLKNNQELCYGNVNQIDWKVTWLIFHYCKGFHCISMRLNYLWTFIAKLFHKILPLGSILAIRKPRLYKEMKCIMKCNKKENWNHLFECQAYEVAWEKILEITTKESIIICLKQKQIRGQGEDFIRKVLQNLLGVTAKSEKFQNIKELIWKPRCEQVILWEKRRGISRTDKITSESKGKDNSNQPSESKVKDNSNKLSNKVKIYKQEK